MVLMESIKNPSNLETEVIDTLNHYGIYQNFRCIKCKQTFNSIISALQHLRSEYLECEEEGIKKQKIIPKRIKEKKYKVKQQRYGNYSEGDKDYMITSGQGIQYLAKRFKTTSERISKIKYNWKRKKKKLFEKQVRKPKGHAYKLNKGTPTPIPAVPADE